MLHHLSNKFDIRAKKKKRKREKKSSHCMCFFQTLLKGLTISTWSNRQFNTVLSTSTINTTPPSSLNIDWGFLCCWKKSYHPSVCFFVIVCFTSIAIIGYRFYRRLWVSLPLPSLPYPIPLVDGISVHSTTSEMLVLISLWTRWYLRSCFFFNTDLILVFCVAFSLGFSIAPSFIIHYYIV